MTSLTDPSVLPALCSVVGLVGASYAVWRETRRLSQERVESLRDDIERRYRGAERAPPSIGPRRPRIGELREAYLAGSIELDQFEAALALVNDLT